MQTEAKPRQQAHASESAASVAQVEAEGALQRLIQTH